MIAIEGNIESIRAIEDAIRATKYYTEGITTHRAKHPIQGNEIPTRSFTKIYEIYLDSQYPDMDSPVMELIKWTVSRAVIVYFWYDYRSGKAKFKVNPDYIDALCEIIPDFRKALIDVTSEASLSSNTLAEGELLPQHLMDTEATGEVLDL